MLIIVMNNKFNLIQLNKNNKNIPTNFEILSDDRLRKMR